METLIDRELLVDNGLYRLYAYQPVHPAVAAELRRRGHATGYPLRMTDQGRRLMVARINRSQIHGTPIPGVDIEPT